MNPERYLLWQLQTSDPFSFLLLPSDSSLCLSLSLQCVLPSRKSKVLWVLVRCPVRLTEQREKCRRYSGRPTLWGGCVRREKLSTSAGTAAIHGSSNTLLHLLEVSQHNGRITHSSVLSATWIAKVFWKWLVRVNGGHIYKKQSLYDNCIAVIIHLCWFVCTWRQSVFAFFE